MSTDERIRGTNVSQEEVDRWVEAVRELAGTSHEDAGNGGIAPATVVAHLDSPRGRTTVHDHLRADDRVVATVGVALDHSKCRESFLPAEEAKR